MSERGWQLAGFARTLPRLGLRNLSRYALHRARSKSGWYRSQQPVQSWESFDAAAGGRIRSPWSPPSASQLASVLGNTEGLAEAARQIESGKVRYFSGPWQDRPAHWQDHPKTGRREASAHWSELPPRLPEDHDVKWVWEPARFAWVFPLGRAWAAGLAPAAPKHFWAWFESFRAENPPFEGIQWACGQECALRLCALVWASAVFENSADSTPSRIQALAGTVAALAERIDQALIYALAQHNNHGLGEALGLYLAGYALPDHPRAERWTDRGRAALRAQVEEQFAEDGSYAQNSTNYHRVALRYLLVALHCARRRGDPQFEEAAFLDRLRKGVAFLFQQQDEASGAVPNYGANDGANPIRLSSCPYDDHRPVLQALHWLLDGRLLFRAGPWNEELLWLGASEADLQAKPSPPERPGLVRFDAGGYFVLRGPKSFALFRCHRHTSRPSHADMLHLDLWWGGLNLFADGGTYGYNDPRHWGEHFKSTAAHNTVEVGGRSQMHPGSRFLWLDWTEGVLLEANEEEGGRASGEHSGYCAGGRGIMHRRHVLVADDDWLIVDDLWTEGASPAQEAVLRWHLGSQIEWSATEDREGGIVALQSPTTEAGIWLGGTTLPRWTLVEGSVEDPKRARSPSYGQLQPCAVLIASTPEKLGRGNSIRWLTAVGSSPLVREGDSLKWRGRPVPTEANEPL